MSKVTGGITGLCVSAAGMIYGVWTGGDGSLSCLGVMFIGALLCAVFAGLLYKGYHRI